MDPDPALRPSSIEDILGHAFFAPSTGAMREHFLIKEVRNRLAMPGGARDCCRVMVSYCWTDSSFVLGRLCLAMAPRVVGLWVDRLGGAQGIDGWARQSMEHGVQDADVVVAVMSPEYLESKNCGFELACASRFGIPVIPIKFGIPFEEWPPTKVGDTTLFDQLTNPNDPSDSALFVDFETPALFETKFHQELLPRLQAIASQQLPERIMSGPTTGWWSAASSSSVSPAASSTGTQLPARETTV